MAAREAAGGGRVRAQRGARRQLLPPRLWRSCGDAGLSFSTGQRPAPPRPRPRPAPACRAPPPDVRPPSGHAPATPRPAPATPPPAWPPPLPTRPRRGPEPPRPGSRPSPLGTPRPPPRVPSQLHSCRPPGPPIPSPPAAAPLPARCWGSHCPRGRLGLSRALGPDGKARTYSAGDLGRRPVPAGPHARRIHAFQPFIEFKRNGPLAHRVAQRWTQSASPAARAALGLGPRKAPGGSGVRAGARRVLGQSRVRPLAGPVSSPPSRPRSWGTWGSSSGDSATSKRS